MVVKLNTLKCKLLKPLSIAFLLIVSPLYSDDIRFVPVHELTNFRPMDAIYHPRDNHRLMVLNQGGRVDIFDINIWSEPKKILEIPTGAYTVAFSPDGKQIVSGADDGTVRIWNVNEAGGMPNTLGTHDGWIFTVAFSPDGKKIVSGGQDGNVRLWNVNDTVGVPYTLGTHDGWVSTVAFSPSGSHIVSGGYDKTMRIWHLDSPNTVSAPLAAHDSTVHSVEFSPDGNFVVSGDAFGVLQLWDVTDLARPTLVGIPIEAHRDELWDVSFSQNGEYIVSGGSDGAIRFWSVADIRSGKKVVGTLIEGHRFGVGSVRFSPDGNRIITSGEDRTVRAWDVHGIVSMPGFLEHGSWATTVSFSPTGGYIASGGYDNIVRLWDVSDFADARLKGELEGHEDVINSLAYSPSSSIIASGSNDGSIILWNIEDIEKPRAMGEPISGDKFYVNAVAFNPDGTHLASGGTAGIRLWHVDEGRLTETWRDAHDAWITAVAFSSDGKYLVSGCDEGLLRLWSVEDVHNIRQIGTPLSAHFGVRSVAFHPDGKHFVSGGDDDQVLMWNVDKIEAGDGRGSPIPGHGGEILSLSFDRQGTYLLSGGYQGDLGLWDFKKGRKISVPTEGHRSWIQSVAFSPDGRHMASAGGDGTIRLWRLGNGTSAGGPLKNLSGLMRNVVLSSTGDQIVSISERGVARLWRSDGVRLLGATKVTSAEFSHDDTRLFLGRDNGAVEIWDTDSATYVGEALGGPRSAVNSIAVGPEGKHVVSVRRDGLAILWDVDSLSSTDHEAAIESAAFSPDGTRVVLGTNDGTVRLWDVRVRDRVGGAGEGHHGPVESVAFSPDGNHVVSGGEDGTVRLWEVNDLRLSGGLPIGNHFRSVWSVDFSIDGERVVSAGHDGNVRIWERDGEQMVQSAVICGSGYREIRSVNWIAPSAIIVGCRDRTVLLNSSLGRTGEVFVLREGLVATIEGHGVYASPPNLKDKITAFIGSEDQGVADVISDRQMQHYLFGRSDPWLIIGTTTERAINKVVEFHRRLGVYSVGLWLLLAEIIGVLAVVTAWLFWPAKLAWWSMPKAGSRHAVLEIFEDSSNPVTARLSGVVRLLTLFHVLGRTKRPLVKWLQESRPEIEERCFTDRTQVRERANYCSVGNEDDTARFLSHLDANERGLIWILGAGGTGKSALAIHVAGETLVGNTNRPIPLYIGEDWKGSLAAQVARYLRGPNWTRGPTENMVKTLGALGLVCPLVDSLSERSDEAGTSVKSAVLEHDFRHVIVTSRREVHDEQLEQIVESIEVHQLKRANILPFIESYRDYYRIDVGSEEVRRRIQPLFDDGRNMPSPLFLRFAIAEATAGPVGVIDNMTLVLRYMEALRADKIDIRSEDMERAAGVAAIRAVQDRLIPGEVSVSELRETLMAEINSDEFYDVAGKESIRPPEVVNLLVESGLLVRWSNTLQFTYDPVAEYLAAWWVRRTRRGNLEGLRSRIERAANTGVGRAYQEVAVAPRQAI